MNERDEIMFLKGSEKFGQNNDQDNAKSVRRELTQLMGSKHIAFLLGAGCSSYKSGDAEIGIPAMKELSKIFLCDLDENKCWSVSQKDQKTFWN